MTDSGRTGRTRRIGIFSALFGIAIVSTLLWIGCNGKSKTQDQAGNGETTDGPAPWTDASIKPAGGPWSGNVQVTGGDWNAFQKLVRSYKGKVVVAGFWASWSDKIVPQIRQLARLQNKYPGKIIVLQVAVDPETEQAQLKQLVSQWVGPELPGDATVRLFISTQVDEDFYKAANTIEALPTIFVYDQNGKRTRIFLGGEKVIDCNVQVVPRLETMLK
jgi:thiol-disulfide isomerase/thioredoxin